MTTRFNSPRSSLRTPGVARARKHSHERGASVFIVTLAILMLTGMGVWSMHFAGLTNKASGYQRLGAQAKHLAELGIMTGTGLFSVPGYANANFLQAQQSLAASTPDTCASVPNAADTFCKAILMSDIDVTVREETVNINAGKEFSILDHAAAGSMGPYATGTAGAIQGTFQLEMSEPQKAIIPGQDVSSAMYQRVTLTSYGLVRPDGAGDTMCSTNENSIGSVVGMRAHAIIGPLSQ